MSLGEVYLLLSAAGAMAVALALLLLPPRLTTGPSLSTVYKIADRHQWGWGFLILSAVCMVGVWRPTESRFIVVLSLVVLVQTCWAVGLTVPAITPGAVANLLAPIAWLQLAGTGLMVGVIGHRPFLPPHRGRGPDKI
ncbi:MAG: hypothetical protein JWP11_47 [Frankiales bacterium]|nr:hypothetical protein [Frankiales bacterium]